MEGIDTSVPVKPFFVVGFLGTIQADFSLS